MLKRLHFLGILLILILLGAACGPAGSPEEAEPAQAADVTEATTATADVSYTLQTSMTDGLSFVGVGGEIEGIVNPTLTASPGDTVSITLINGDGMLHDLTIDEFEVTTDELAKRDASATITFTVPESGDYTYFCSIPGHRQAGMEGILRVGTAADVPASGGVYT